METENLWIHAVLEWGVGDGNFNGIVCPRFFIEFRKRPFTHLAAAVLNNCHFCETFLHYCHICVPSEKSFDVVHTHITSAATWRLLVLLIQLLAEIDGRHIIRKCVYLKAVSFQSHCSGLKINSVVKAISPGVECSLYVDDFLSCYIYFDK